MSVAQFVPEQAQAFKLYPSKPKKVYVFGTCLVDLFYPEAGMASIHLLEFAGVEPIFPQAQSCCGQPAYTSGYQEEARAVALAQMAIFQQDDWPIVVPSGSCGGMMKLHYPRLFEGTVHAQQAQVFAERIYEVSEFLVHVCNIELTDVGAPSTVALHTSCSSRREMKTVDSGKALLGKLSGVTVVEPHKVQECCGFGGAFAVRHASISNAMVTDKLTHLQATQAQNFVSSDCGCLMNIRGAAEKSAQVSAMQTGEHLLSFVARRAGLLMDSEVAK